MFDNLDNQQLLIETIIAYKNYIDASAELDEQSRSDLLMVARNLDGELVYRGVYVG